MKVVIRRVGNSLGLILPKATLEAWKVNEGDFVEVTDRGVRPLGKTSPHEALHELKRVLAHAVVRQFTSREIRAQSLANLHRWKGQGTWVSAYDEWKRILDSGDDGALYAAMLGRDDRSNRLRQSMPFVGLLSQHELAKVHEEA